MGFPSLGGGFDSRIPLYNICAHSSVGRCTILLRWGSWDRTPVGALKDTRVLLFFMDDKSIFELVETCNPVVGCTYQGCRYCYAKKINDRFKLIPDWTNPVEKPQALKKIHAIKPKSFLMTSMSDLADWRPDYRDEVFNEMRKYPRHKYLFLTKRPQEIKGLDCRDMKNVWIGSTITMKSDLWRISSLKQTVKAHNYCLCIEPLLGDLGTIDLSGIDNIVIGAETGNSFGKVRPQASWVNSLIDQADQAGVPVWTKDSLAEIIGPENIRRDKVGFLQ